MTTNKKLLAGYGLAAGILLSIFVMIPGMLRYFFSLGAIMAGMQYFKREEARKPRIWFVALVFLLALILPVLYVTIAYMGGGYVNPRWTE